MADKNDLLDALERWAKEQPDKLAWQFYNDKLEVEDSYTYKVSFSVSKLATSSCSFLALLVTLRNLTMPQVRSQLTF
jgi:hypothetical protein